VWSYSTKDITKELSELIKIPDNQILHALVQLRYLDVELKPRTQYYP